MQRHPGLLLVGLIFCAALSETFGLVLSAKEKRGWTMNSAGYLLGPLTAFPTWFNLFSTEYLEGTSLPLPYLNSLRANQFDLRAVFTSRPCQCIDLMHQCSLDILVPFHFIDRNNIMLENVFCCFQAHSFDEPFFCSCLVRVIYFTLPINI
uniref:Galanin domain-containing protein n=1 Tax=Laticauda laticaudata TaxID=8630 RepID=A0A8C5WRT0_LATLA